jgi:hypothetical protein
MKIKLEIPLYDIKIKFYFDYDLGNPIKKIKKKHNKKKLYNVRSKIDFCGIVIGEFIPNNKLIYVLIGKSKNGINVDTLTHEIYHLTSKIMKYNGFNFKKSDEPFAMLNGKLNSMIIGKLIKNGDKLYYPIETKKIK